MFKWLLDIVDRIFDYRPDAATNAAPARPAGLSDKPPFITYNKSGIVIECEKQWHYDTEYMHFTVRVDDTADGCDCLIRFYTYEFDTLQLVKDDRVQLSFATDPLTSIIRAGHLLSFSIDYDQRKAS